MGKVTTFDHRFGTQTRHVMSYTQDDPGATRLAEDCVRTLLTHIGENPNREGLKETPSRVIKSFGKIYEGYQTDISSLFKTFEDGACDEMVILRNTEFYSVCEHHMQPFFGHASIAYIPNKRVIGVSKLARILDAFSRRLQIQERLTSQITTALMEHLQPRGAGCILTAKHFCMVCRGVQKQNSEMITSSLLGEFREDPAVRQEFLSLTHVR